MVYITDTEDEFPDIEVIFQRQKQKSTAKGHDGDKEKQNMPTKPSLLESMDSVLDESLGKTPATARRRRKLGQAQPVGGSLLKPWRPELEEKESDTSRAPTSRAHSWSRMSNGDTSNPSIGDLLDRFPVKAKPAEPRRVLSGTKFDSPPEERKRTRTWMSRGDMKTLQLNFGQKEKGDAGLELSSDSESADGKYGKLNIRIQDDDNDSDFILSGDSDSDLDLTPPRRAQSPTRPRRMQRRVLSSSRDPTKKPPAWTQSIQDDPVRSSKKWQEKLDARKESAPAKAKAAQKGNLEDVFDKLKISDDESQPEDTKAKGNKTPVLKPTIPKKTLVSSPARPVPIPASPWKPEHKEFWDPAANIAWVDQNSPPKNTTAPKPIDLTGPDSKAALDLRYGTSPEKKKAKKAFDAIKGDLACSFLQELDWAITDGKLGKMTESTGGLRIVWSNKLLTTAGRASWKSKTKSPKGPPSQQPSSAPPSSQPAAAKSIVEHYARIDLATKVLSNEADLLNTVAHEFCHIAVFLLHGNVTFAHGVEFKTFGRRVMASTALQTPRDRGVEIHITTRHDYKIDYRFVWRCEDCGTEVRRHSRSVDPKRHRCGKCQGGVLVQMKPVPRGGGNAKKGQAGDGHDDDAASNLATGDSQDAVISGGGAAEEKKTKKPAAPAERKRSAYQDFTAREMKALSVSHKGLSFKEKMALVSARWAEHQKGLKMASEEVSLLLRPPEPTVVEIED
ncbi:hypothetical protein GGS21DRAFT_518432 [Xylaria nigripes]|nr:hypothetical protein GGS21DRAFT_518432 [Xylaria nigripes]